MTPVFPSQFGRPSSSIAHHPRDSGSSFTTFAVTREDQGWPIPARSMSFGQVEDVPNNYANSYHQGFQMDFQRRGSEMHPPLLITSSNSSNTSILEPQIVPHSASVTSQQVQHFIAPSWNALPGHQSVGKVPEYNGWFSPEPALLAQVQEEDIAPPFGDHHGILYSSPGLH